MKYDLRVSLHDRDEVVGQQTGQSLIDALQSSPHREIDIEPSRSPMPVRDVSL